MATREPRNPFYILLLAASFLFVATALAYGVFPVMEDNAVSIGQKPPPSAFRAALRADGPKWLLYELGAMTILVGFCFGLDWWRSNKAPGAEIANQRAEESPTQSS